MIGRRYKWRGETWTVLCRWSGSDCPRNVLIENDAGERVVRPFRGLRRADAGDNFTATVEGAEAYARLHPG